MKKNIMYMGQYTLVIRDVMLDSTLVVLYNGKEEIVDRELVNSCQEIEKDEKKEKKLLYNKYRRKIIGIRNFINYQFIKCGHR